MLGESAGRRAITVVLAALLAPTAPEGRRDMSHGRLGPRFPPRDGDPGHQVTDGVCECSCPDADVGVIATALGLHTPAIGAPASLTVQPPTKAVDIRL